ncbi:hypothetical protein HCN44_002280 [Aphidius gifuensis]|uniref:F-box domain-containing protein n=1 Tax=Aphidius gifuensis TaxID=684658 RepID=A0A835CUX7_APHGI|nr:hypothetical protein HCN44_002280 [Aphidius gifuensis]
MDYDDSVETKTDLINILDDDSLSIIFSYLQPLELVEIKEVSQRWNYLADLAWIYIKKFEYTNQIFGYENNWRLINFNQLKNVILNCGRYLTHLTLKNLCGSEIVPLIRDHCHNLVRLELVLLLMINRDDFKFAFTKMNQLNYISISMDPVYHWNDECLYGAILSTLHSSINEIHFPSICDSRENKPSIRYCNSSFVPWMKKFDNLQALTLHYQAMDEHDMSTILNFKTLLHLSLSNSKIEDYCLIGLSNLINLEYLDLSYVDEVDNYVVWKIADNCCKLKYLNLKKCSSVTGKSINKLTKLIDLEHLIVEKLSL